MQYIITIPQMEFEIEADDTTEALNKLRDDIDSSIDWNELEINPQNNV